MYFSCSNSAIREKELKYPNKNGVYIKIVQHIKKVDIIFIYKH